MLFLRERLCYMLSLLIVRWVKRKGRMKLFKLQKKKIINGIPKKNRTTAERKIRYVRIKIKSTHKKNETKRNNENEWDRIRSWEKYSLVAQCLHCYHNALYSSLCEKKSPFFSLFFFILLNRNSCICCTFHYYLHFKDR